MDFFKVKKFRKAHKPVLGNDLDYKPVPQPEEPKENGGAGGGDDVVQGNNKTTDEPADPSAEAEDDDDDFITNEVMRRLKELRRNSFMVLIPEEESCGEEDEEEDEEQEVDQAISSSQWRDVEAEARQWWGGFDALYDKYCERMLFFDRMSAQQLHETGCPTPTTPSPRSASKKLASPLRCLSLKKIEEPDDETEHLQQPQIDPYHDIETAYVAQICLTWEALHCQYTQRTQKILCQPEDSTCYNHSAQLFQQFQVLLQRYIENEPFEQGLRPEIYARARKLLPKLLQVPNAKASDQKDMDGEESSLTVLAPDLIKIMESSILTFHLFLKMDKKKSNGACNLFGNQNQTATLLHQVQSSHEKKLVKLKELRKRRRGWKKRSWPLIQEDVHILFSLIDVKLLSRVLRMARISKEQLVWCEDKMKKIDLVDGKIRRDPSPIFFPF